MTPDLDKLKEQAPRIVAALRQSAKAASNTLRLMAEAKSLRQGHNPPRADLYAWPKPEETTGARAADLIESLIAKAERVDALEAAIEPLLSAVEADFTDEITDAEAPDTDPVHGMHGGSHITFGMIRAARNALSPKPEDAAS